MGAVGKKQSLQVDEQKFSDSSYLWWEASRGTNEEYPGSLGKTHSVVALTLGGEFIETLIVRCNFLLHYKHEQKKRVKGKTLG